MFKSISYKLFRINGRIIFIILWFGITLDVNSQIVYYQESIAGGVTVGGFSTAQGSGSGIVTLHIEPGSQIKKAILFSYSASNSSNRVIINGDSIYVSQNNKIKTFSFTVNNYNPISIHAINITAWAQQQGTSTFTVEVPFQIGMPYSAVFAPFLCIIYENPILPPVACTIILNQQDLIGSQYYQLSGLLPINNLFPAGFAPYLDRVTQFRQDAENVYFMGNYVGQLCGTDAVNINFSNGGGVKGHFYYQNNVLFGLDDDTPSQIVDSTDALLDFSSFVSNNSTSINFKFEHNEFPNQPITGTNLPLVFFLAYTSPCDTFSVTHTPDTTVCHGTQLPLFVTGGQAYEWTPQVGLSCYDCPNPIFSADSTMHYSIRIWNNDSCSKVLPLHIIVEEALPHFNFDISPSECGDSTGSITVTPALNGFSYINQATQDTNTTGFFSGLESGFYPISIGNNSACSFDTIVFVPETLSVDADFIASPNAGISPLPVAFTNTSSHANSYQWIYENQTSNQENLSYTFQQDGIYPVMLIAYGNSILCADTAYDTIYVYLPIEVEIPNIFTPNSDQNNDQWGIKINVPAEVDLQIFNRWGEIIVNRKEEVLSPGFTPLWDGGEHVGGVYYYVLRLKTDFEKKEFKGNLTLVR